jgi:hypothetical protein
MNGKHLRLKSGLACVALLSLSGVASAATSITNSLTGFTGNSTQPATQAAVAAAGFNFTSTEGSVDPNDPTVVFDTSGAAFGTFIPGDPGRNFMRTVATDYANHSFVAEVTWVTFDMFSQAAYFGLGSAEYGSFRIADWGTQFSAVQLFLEVDPVEPEVFTLKNDNTSVIFDAGTDVPGLDTGTNRLRMSYDWFRKTMDFAIDVNYSSGAFTADVTVPGVNTLSLYGSDGWPTEPARVYFGGDDGTTFKDFQVTLSTPSMILGDFDNSGTITTADWMVLRSNQHANLSALTFAQAYARGDLTADKANNHADFALFKALYDEANGVGAFDVMAANVPEPAAGLVALAAALAALPVVRRARNSH